MRPVSFPSPEVDGTPPTHLPGSSLCTHLRTSFLLSTVHSGHRCLSPGLRPPTGPPACECLTVRPQDGSQGQLPAVLYGSALPFLPSSHEYVQGSYGALCLGGYCHTAGTSSRKPLSFFTLHSGPRVTPFPGSRLHLSMRTPRFASLLRSSSLLMPPQHLLLAVPGISYSTGSK